MNNHMMGRTTASDRLGIHLTGARLQQVAFTGITEEDLKILHAQEALFGTITDLVVDELYERLLQEPELAAIINSHSTLDRLKGTQRWYFQSLTAGLIDEAFFERRLHIGRIHSRIGLTTNWYLGTYMLYLQIATQQLKRALPDQWAVVVMSLSKLFNLDSQVVLEAYEEDEKEKIQRMVEEKQHLLLRVNAAVQELTSMIAELNASSRKMADSAENTAELQRSSNEQVKELHRQVEDIGSLGTTMKEVSDQTHLIGLNASIEAARAGEEGRGFAVVANEIRKLAANSKQSLGLIQEKLGSIYTALNLVQRGSDQTVILAEGQAASSQELSAFVQMIESVALELEALQQE
ncbi:methyl-accepting chemotaxis sensory transducer [Paenibacillus curdlanolyticus YK9]|uniref:Methyl-accepting chemotaxis sensory transducer n=1 Tax=Paenibacillus curdlanolyticus YK9 TaxID=717606 RepID=E0IBA0_9BACL|nr:globin-coupled sensor protein [Paenibacillus curdlanolyticus]EFM10391.1 methyl-accepting chemotaxis sensory transducer [Paenibacillus curdlanolyticus YK9]